MRNQVTGISAPTFVTALGHSITPPIMAVTLRKILTRLLAYLLLAIVVSVLLSTVRFFMSTP